MDVAIHPQRATHLARRLAAAGDEWRHLAADLAHLLGRAEAPATAATVVAAVATEAGALAAHVRAVVAEVEALEAGAPLGALGLVPLHGPFTVPGLDDATAGAEADAAFAAFEQGDVEGFLARTRTYGCDPRFASAFAARLDAVAVVDLLATYRVALGAGPGDLAARRAGAASAGALQALATASAAGDLRLTFADLADAAAAAGGRAGVDLGLLFVPPGIAWGGGFLASAALGWALPAGAAVRAGTDPLAFSWPAPSGALVDTRTALLSQLAAHPEDAAAVLTRADPADLFSAAAGPGDGGRSARDLLLAGTDPGVPGGPTAAARVLSWLGAEDVPPLAPAVHAGLGRAVAPYLGSLGPPHPPGRPASVPALVAPLDPDASRRVFRLVALDDTALAELRTLGLRWAAIEIDWAGQLGRPGLELAALDEIGGIWGHAGAGMAAGAVQGAVERDRADAAARARVSMALSGLTAPFKAVSNVAAVVLPISGTLAVDRIAPPGEHAAAAGNDALHDFSHHVDELKAVYLRRVGGRPYAELPPDAVAAKEGDLPPGSALGAGLAALGNGALDAARRPNPPLRR